MLFSSLLVAAGLPLLALGARRRATTSSTFQLYAYGEGIGGLPIFYENGYAYAGDSKLSNSSDAAPVIFSSTDDTTFLGSPNTTDITNTPSWSNLTMFVPYTNASDRRVGFEGNSSDTTHIRSGFILYGSTAVLTSSNGLETLWSGAKLESGVYSLHWNDSSDGMVPLTLRRIAPSSPAELQR